MFDHIEAAVVQNRVGDSRAGGRLRSPRGRPSPELLVFEQAGNPEAGVQIPAGGVLPRETPEQAVGHDDAGMIFECRFVPLPMQRPLADDQDVWLREIDPAFTTLTRR